MTAVCLVLPVGLLTVGAGAVSDSFAGFKDTILQTESLCQDLIQREVFSLTATLYAMYC